MKIDVRRYTSRKEALRAFKVFYKWEYATWEITAMTRHGILIQCSEIKDKKAFLW